MNWLILTFVSVFFRAVYGVMTKVLSNKVKVSVYTQAMSLSLASAVLTLIASPLLGGLKLDFSGVSIIMVLLVMVGQGLGNVTYFAAIKHLTNGTAQIAFSSILVFNTLLALGFMGLQLSFINVIGIVILLIAITSVVTGKVELNKRGVAMMMLSALCFAVFQLSSSAISKQVGAASYLLIAYIGAAAVIFVLQSKVIVKDIIQTKQASIFIYPAITAFPSLINLLFAYYAYRVAPEPAKVAMLLTSQVVVTVFLSYFFLKEKGHMLRKVIAAVLVVVAAILIKI